jgi:hypothetical protein
MAPINCVFKTMPTPDASQFTQFKKYAALDSRANTSGGKQITHLSPYIPTALRPRDFLASFSGKLVRPQIYLGINYPAGHGSALTKVFVPTGALTSKYTR